MVASALGSCIFHHYGYCSKGTWLSQLMEATCKITKIMTDNPRKIGEIKIEFDLDR